MFAHVCFYHAPHQPTRLWQEHYPDAYAITYWAHTWGDDPASKAEHAKREEAAKAGAASAETEDAALLASAAAIADPAATADPQPAKTQDTVTEAALPKQQPVAVATDARTTESAQLLVAAVEHPAQETASVQTEAAQART